MCVSPWSDVASGTGVLDLRQYAAPRPSLAELSTYAELRRGNVQKQVAPIMRMFNVHQ